MYGKFSKCMELVFENSAHTFHFFSIHFFDFVFEKVRWGDTLENFFDRNFFKKSFLQSLLFFFRKKLKKNSFIFLFKKYHYHHRYFRHLWVLGGQVVF